MTLIPPSPAPTTPTTHPQGFLLLTIANATLTSTSPQHRLLTGTTPLTGLLSLECVTIPVSDPLVDRDVWLVLRVERDPQASFEFPLPSTQKIVLSRRENRYTMPITGGDGELVLVLPPPKDASAREDLETLEVILAQYAVLQTQEDTTITPLGASAPSSYATTTPVAGYSNTAGYGAVDGVDADLKGRLVLVDEDNGQVVGMLDDHFDIREDTGLHAEGSEKHPVIVEIPEDASVGSPGSPGQGQRVKRQIFVHTMPVDDSDWISKTAGLLGHGVVLATNVLSSGVTTAANFYISHSTPASEPIVFSENTRKNIKRVHNISGQAVRVTAKTTGLIHQAVERLADAVTGGSKAPHSTPGPKHGLGGILKATNTNPTPSPALSKDGSKEWTSGYSGPNSPAQPGSSASSIRPGAPPSYYTEGLNPQPTPPPLPPRRRLLNRLLTSTDMLLTTVETSAGHLISHTTSSLSAAAHHKYGEDMGSAVGLVGESVKNVGVVYVDARGVGRRALLKVAGKRVIRGRMGGREVVFQESGVGRGVVIDQGIPQGVGVSPQGGGSGDGYGPPPFPPPGVAPGGTTMPGGYSSSKTG